MNQAQRDYLISSIEDCVFPRDFPPEDLPYGTLLDIQERAKQPRYDDLVAQTNEWDFIHSADYHYFVARLFFLQQLDHYALFAGQQCIENYLKAYFRFRKEIPPNQHDLKKLLEECGKRADPAHAFIGSKMAEVIALRFNAFNEVARYPVQRFGPPKGWFAVGMPTDMQVLDLFVFRMREIFGTRSDDWDLIGTGEHQYLQSVKTNHPELFEMFVQDNINFATL